MSISSVNCRWIGNPAFYQSILDQSTGSALIRIEMSEEHLLCIGWTIQNPFAWIYCNSTKFSYAIILKGQWTTLENQPHHRLEAILNKAMVWTDNASRGLFWRDIARQQNKVMEDFHATEITDRIHQALPRISSLSYFMKSCPHFYLSF